MQKYNFFIIGLCVVFFSSPMISTVAKASNDPSIIIGATFNTKVRPFTSPKEGNGKLFVYLPEPADSYAEVPIVLNKLLLINKKQLGFKDGGKVYYAIRYEIRGREAIQNASACDGSIALMSNGKTLESIGLLLTPKVNKEYPFSNTAPWFDCKLVPAYK